MKIPNMTGLNLGGVLGIKMLRCENNRSVWLWKCQCGNEFERTGAAVRFAVRKFGKTSCGCIHRAACSRNGMARKTHGLSQKKLYDVYRQMLRRCSNPASKDYKGYGGRGIVVCDEWLDINVFFKWAIDSGYRDGLTIERINNNSNYEPANCRWIPNEQQSHNTRRNKFITFNGKTLHVSEWSRVLEISVRTLLGRIKRNWPTEKILTVTPVKGRNQYSDPSIRPSS